MAIAEAASGPIEDNAGKGKMGMDDAISAAMDASEDLDLSSAIKEVGQEKADKVKTRVEAKSAKNIAGDEADSEDTAADDASKLTSEDDEGDTPSPSAPKHWPDADKQAFAKMTREGQEIALRLAKNLEGGFTRKSQELSDKARFADGVRGLFDDAARDQLRSAGLDEVGYVRYLHELQTFATKKPVEYVKWAMQNLGVKPEHLGISQAPTQQGSTSQDDQLAALLADPKVSALEAKLQTLEGYIQKEQQAKQHAERASHANAVNGVTTLIRSFREALDDNGQLQYPHFDTVQRQMGAMMDTDPDLAKLPDGPDKLKAAYDMAVWARPDSRASFIEQEAQKTIQQAQKKRDAERAKRVTSVKPAAGVVSTKQKANSLDESLDLALSKLGH